LCTFGKARKIFVAAASVRRAVSVVVVTGAVVTGVVVKP
jgi:hypothetical protein